MVDRTKIVRCRQSTIAEAWTTIVGVAGPVDVADGYIIARAGQEAFPEGRLHLARIIDQDSEPREPFWSQEMTWGTGQRLARFGHRFLSVHYVRPSGAEPPYGTYSSTLRDSVSKWVNIVGGAVKGGDGKLVDRIGFGYVNRFFLPPKDFDLSRYFKVNVGLGGIDADDTAAAGFGVQFRLRDVARDVDILIELSAEAAGASADEILVTTKVFAEQRVAERVTFGDTQAIEDAIYTTKEVAKSRFFSMATDQTLAILEAEDS